MWTSDLKWGMNSKPLEWVLSTVDTGTIVSYQPKMWRSIPHWIYTRDGMGYQGSRKKLFVMEHKT